jgi:hypothetical protein
MIGNKMLGLGDNSQKGEATTLWSNIDQSNLKWPAKIFFTKRIMITNKSAENKD